MIITSFFIKDGCDCTVCGLFVAQIVEFPSHVSHWSVCTEQELPGLLLVNYDKCNGHLCILSHTNLPTYPRHICRKGSVASVKKQMLFSC